MVSLRSNVRDQSAHWRSGEAPGLRVGAGAVCMTCKEVVRELIPACISQARQLVRSFDIDKAIFVEDRSWTLAVSLGLHRSRTAAQQGQIPHQSTVPPQSASIFMNSCAKAAFDRPAPKVGPSFSLKLSASSSPPSACKRWLW